jgi:HAE1 family hydrophobic/amphiphilic exporter-1
MSWPLRHPIAVIPLFAMVVIAGLISWPSLPVQLLPNLTYPSLVVLTSYGEAAPEEVDTLVTRPIEATVSTVKGLRSLNSVSTNGTSTITLRFDWGTAMSSASAEVREKLDLITGDLPREVKLPIVMHYNPANAPTVVLALSGFKDLKRLRVTAETEVVPELERLPGVAAVRVRGGLVPEIQILADRGRLAAHDIGLEELFNHVKNANVNFPGGKMARGPVEFSLRTVGRFKSLEDMEQVPLGTSTKGGLVRVKDVARILKTYKDKTGISSINGNPAVLLNIIKEPEANTVKVSRGIRAQVAQLKRSLPDGMHFEIAMDQGPFIEEALRNLRDMVLIGSTLAFLVLLVGLRRVRSSVLVMISIPVSVFSTFGLMALFGVSVNFMSVGGLALGVGMLVDSSIVVLESIHRNRRSEADLLIAAEKGLNEVKTSVISGTVTTIVVLVPIMFMTGLGQRLFRDLAFTLSASLLVSLLVSLVLLPALVMLTDWGRLKVEEPTGSESFLTKTYGRAVGGCLRHSVLVLGLSVLVFIASVCMIVRAGFEVLPTVDRGRFMVHVVLPPDTNIETLENAVAQAENRIKRVPGVADLFSEAGGESGDNGAETTEIVNPNEARITVSVEQGRETDRVREQIIKAVRSSFAGNPAVQVDPAPRESFLEKSLGVTGSPEILRITGDDLVTLSELADLLKGTLAGIDTLRDVRSEGNVWVEQKRVVVDRYKAAAYKLTNMDIAGQVRTAVEGSVAGKFLEDGRETDIRVRLNPADVGDTEALKHIRVLPPGSTESSRKTTEHEVDTQIKTIPLYQVAGIESGRGPRKILRSERRRNIVIRANVKGGAFSKAQEQAQKAAQSLVLPDGYEILPGFESFQLVSSMRSLAIALALAVMLVYMVLVIHFESFRWPLVILMTIPLTIWGPALVVTVKDMPVSLLVVIGALVLVGIVVNNAILIATYVQQLRSRIPDFRRALIQGASLRLKPILMSTFTTVMGALPICFGLGGTALAVPLALTVISGLMASLVMTLFVVPVLLDLCSGTEYGSSEICKSDTTP